MTLDEIRKNIDTIDLQIHHLLNQRAKLALAAGQVKRAETGNNTTFLRPEREKQILLAVSKNNQGPLSNQTVSSIFNAIINACRALQVSQLRARN